ncbi:CBS domain-containing protein [Haloarcula sp. AONF1]
MNHRLLHKVVEQFTRMLVENLMNTDVATVDINGTVRAAVEMMLRKHIGSVIVVTDDNPTGIVTETDVLEVGYATDDCFSEIQLNRVMSHPLITTAPNKSLRTAMRIMRDENIKKLPVQDGTNIAGILTMTDINRQYNEIVQEIHAMEQPRGLSEAELQGLNSQYD